MKLFGGRQSETEKLRERLNGVEHACLAMHFRTTDMLKTQAKDIAALLAQVATLSHLLGKQNARIDILTTKGNTMENTQDDYNAVITRLEADIQSNGTAIQQVTSVTQSNAAFIASLQSQIADLQKAQPRLDLAAISKDLDNLEHNTAGLVAILAPVGTTTSTAPIVTGPAANPDAPLSPTSPNGGQVGDPTNPNPEPPATAPVSLDPPSDPAPPADAPVDTPPDETPVDAPVDTVPVNTTVNPDAPLDTSADSTATTGSGTGNTDATTATQDTGTDGVTAQTQAPS